MLLTIWSASHESHFIWVQQTQHDADANIDVEEDDDGAYRTLLSVHLRVNTLGKWLFKLYDSKLITVKNAISVNWNCFYLCFVSTRITFAYEEDRERGEKTTHAHAHTESEGVEKKPTNK